MSEWKITSTYPIVVPSSELPSSFNAVWHEEAIGEYHWYAAWAKWDGCVEFTRYFNEPMEMQKDKPDDDQYYDQIHFCNLDEEIERLTKLRDLMRATFQVEVPG